MPTSLVACPACRRHHLPSEDCCPFCGAEAGQVAPANNRRQKATSLATVALAAAITSGAGALAASHAGLPFRRASPIVDLTGHVSPVEHVAVPAYGVAPPPDWESGPHCRGEPVAYPNTGTPTPISNSK